jgi:RNA polymerase primary sigma factor
MNELITKWKKTKEQLTQKLKRTATDQEIIKRMKISKDKVDQINFWISSTTSSLEAPVGEESESQVMDLVQDETAVAPDARIEHLLDKERVKRLLRQDVVTLREKEILDMRFGLSDGKQHTLAEVSKKVGVSRERIRQIEEEALEKLRRFVTQQEKKPFILE